ncbi:MAG: GbsR/MarR family transcriptional regulator [Bdellovibrio sp.]
MKNQELSKLCDLAALVGDFMRYWGFRKIHGEIWTLVYLTQHPLSGADIVKSLDVSKALVSPALKELEAEGLIFLAPSENSKTKRYQAEEDVTKIIRGVLQRRERPLLDQILKAYQALESQNPTQSALQRERLEKVGTMIQTAQMGLHFLTDSDQMWT